MPQGYYDPNTGVNAVQASKKKKNQKPPTGGTFVQPPKIPSSVPPPGPGPGTTKWNNSRGATGTAQLNAVRAAMGITGNYSAGAGRIAARLASGNLTMQELLRRRLKRRPYMGGWPQADTQYANTFTAPGTTIPSTINAAAGALRAANARWWVPRNIPARPALPAASTVNGYPPRGLSSGQAALPGTVTNPTVTTPPSAPGVPEWAGLASRLAGGTGLGYAAYTVANAVRDPSTMDNGVYGSFGPEFMAGYYAAKKLNPSLTIDEYVLSL